MFPITGYTADKLPNGSEWFDSVWSELIQTASRNLAPHSTSKVWGYIFVTLFVIAASVCGLFVGGGVGAGIGWAFGDVVGVALSTFLVLLWE